MYFFWQLATSKVVALWLARALFVGCFFIPVCFFHHVICLVGRHLETHKARLVRWGYAIACMFCLLNITPLMVSDVQTRLNFPYWPQPGPFMHFYTAFFFFFVGYGTWLLYRACQHGPPGARGQLRPIFFGTVIAFAGGSTNFLLIYDIPIPPFGNVVVPLYVTIVSYAIMRYRFMDIQIVITRTGLLLGTYLVVLGAPFLVGWFGRPWLEASLGSEWWLVPLGLCTALATIGPFAYAFLRRQAEARLLSEQRRYQRTLQLAARGMTRVRNIVKLTHLITRLVSRTVHVTHASLFLWDETHQCYVLRASHGPKRLSIQSRYGLENGHPFIQWLQTHRRVLTGDALAREADLAVGKELMSLGAELVIPGLVGNRLIGFLVLGPKRSGAAYSWDDLHAFATLANEAAIAIENALSYEELLKANEHLKAASARLLIQERQAAAGQFATGMAHEIKNPLSAIKTFAQFLPEKYKDQKFRERFFRIVQSEIDRIDTIVRDLSDFAKPAPLKLQPTSVSSLAKDTLALLSNHCLKQGIEVHADFQENGLTIQADPQQLKQIVLNLLLNSIEAMANGGRLDVSTRRDQSRLVLRVADTGCGVPPDRLQEIWDPFFTTKERGMGLGLAIVKSIVERHGGELHLSSRPGKGTAIEVSLPVAPRSGKVVSGEAAK